MSKSMSSVMRSLGPIVVLALCGCGSSSSSPSAPDLAQPGSLAGDMASAGGTGGNGSSGGTSDMATASGGGGATTTTIKIAVPSTYTGQARQILVAAFDNFPVTGPPSGVIYMADNPVLTAGQTVTLTGDASKLTGTKYVIAVVYMTGGGTFSPKAGVDYESSDEKIVFTGQPIDLGTLTLALAM